MYIIQQTFSLLCGSSWLALTRTFQSYFSFELSQHGNAVPCEVWIYIGANTSGCESSNPVINLRTCESGTVEINQVYWYPKLQRRSLCPKSDPHRQEIWTTDGETRVLKHCGSRMFTYRQWIICQYLDGTKSTTKSVEVPAKDSQLNGISHLSLSESRSYFASRCSKMLGESLATSCAKTAPTEPVASRQTPPVSPELECRKTTTKRKRTSTMSMSALQAADNAVQEGMGDLPAARPNAKRPCILRESLIHPREKPTTSWSFPSLMSSLKPQSI